MSASHALQVAIYNALVADEGVGALVGDRIYDGIPKDAVYPCIEFGRSDYVAETADCVTSRTETLQLDCWAKTQGRRSVCIKIVDAVQEALHQCDLPMAEPYRALWVEANGRAEEDPDGITWHGIVTVEVEVQKHGSGA